MKEESPVLAEGWLPVPTGRERPFRPGLAAVIFAVAIGVLSVLFATSHRAALETESEEEGAADAISGEARPVPGPSDGEAAEDTQPADQSPAP